MYDINKSQLRLDMTLKTERTIAENVQTAIEFTMMQLIQGDPPPSAVRDRHAAYGVAAQNYAKAAASLKKIKSDMDALLDTLDDISHPASSVVDTLSPKPAFFRSRTAVRTIARTTPPPKARPKLSGRCGMTRAAPAGHLKPKSPTKLLRLLRTGIPGASVLYSVWKTCESTGNHHSTQNQAQLFVEFTV